MFKVESIHFWKLVGLVFLHSAVVNLTLAYFPAIFSNATIERNKALLFLFLTCAIERLFFNIGEEFIFRCCGRFVTVTECFRSGQVRSASFKAAEVFLMFHSSHADVQSLFHPFCCVKTLFNHKKHKCSEASKAPREQLQL